MHNKTKQNDMNKEFLHMQKLAGLITESEYAAKLEELEVRGKVGKSYPAPTQKPEREISDLWKRYGFLDLLPGPRGLRGPPGGSPGPSVRVWGTSRKHPGPTNQNNKPMSQTESIEQSSSSAEGQIAKY